jgi:hypothetical protein
MRLLPRFSLRVAWIVLTILLLVFGVGGNYWNRYHEHERVAKNLESLGFTVEEEPITLFGELIGKRLVGLQGECNDDLDIVAAALREIPDKTQLRRFSCGIPYFNFLDEAESQEILPQQQALFAAIAEFSELEVLDLNPLKIRAGSLQCLGKLQALRRLNLYDCAAPPREVRQLLEQLPNLEQLYLKDNMFSLMNLDDVLPAALPKLRHLYLRHEPESLRVNLTKAGLGRFPNLEVVVLDGVQVHKVAFEPGAMPRLKLLDLSGASKATPVEWAKLPAAAPQLTALVVHCEQVRAPLMTMLSQTPMLQKLYLHGLESALIRSLPGSQNNPISYAAKRLPYGKLPELVTRCPQLKYDSYSELRSSQSNPWELNIVVQGDYHAGVTWQIKSQRRVLSKGLF